MKRPPNSPNINFNAIVKEIFGPDFELEQTADVYLNKVFDDIIKHIVDESCKLGDDNMINRDIIEKVVLFKFSDPNMIRDAKVESTPKESFKKRLDAVRNIINSRVPDGN